MDIKIEYRIHYGVEVESIEFNGIRYEVGDILTKDNFSFKISNFNVCGYYLIIVYASIVGIENSRHQIVLNELDKYIKT